MKQFLIFCQKICIHFFLTFLLSGLYFHVQSAVNDTIKISNFPTKFNISAHSDIPIQPFAPSGLLCELLSHPELSLINNPSPDFSWIVNSDKPGDFQTAYKI